MSANLLLDNFHTLAEAPNGVQALRDLVLQLAIRGRLIPQDPADEPAANLLRETKQSLQDLDVKSNELPAEEDIMSFLPNSWEAERLGNIATAVTKGSTPTSYGFSFQDSGIRFVKVENVKNGWIQHHLISDFISAEAHESQKRSQLEEKDILFSIAGTIGETCVVRKDDLPANTNQALAIIRGTSKVFDPAFLKLQLDSFVANAVRNRARGGAMNNVSLGDLKGLLVLVPPSQEQRRIVAKVDQLMALCDELEKRQEKKHQVNIQLNESALNKLTTAGTPEEFAGDWQRIKQNFDLLYDTPENVGKLKQAILQLAVQGKLVPQNPKDEPASVLLEKIKAEKERLVKEKKIKKSEPLPPIGKDEVPYELPKGWVWTRLVDVYDVRDGTHESPKYHAKGIPFVTSKNLYHGTLDLSNVRYISKEDHLRFCDRSKVDRNDILFAMIGSIGNPVIVDTDVEFSAKNVALFKYYSLQLSVPKYLHYFLMYAESLMKDTSLGGVQSFVSLAYLRKYPFPLPPIEEQKRIVRRVSELLAQCDELETKLARSQSAAERLVEGVVRGVVQT